MSAAASRDGHGAGGAASARTRRLVRLAFGLALAGCAAELVRFALASAGGPLAHAGLFYRVKWLALVAVGASYAAGLGVRAAHAARALWRYCEARPRLALGALIAATWALAALLTPQIAFRGGYGDDGSYYGWMAEHFAARAEGVMAPYGYRFGVPLLVHWSGLPVFTGFAVVDAAAFVVACLALHGIARHFGARPGVALLCVLAFASLKYGLAFWIYYPLLTDAAGTALLLLILYATLRERPWLYAGAMAAAVVVRENLLPLALFHVLHALRVHRDGPAVLRSLALQTLPLAAFVASRALPVFEPLGPYAERGVLGSFGVWARMLVESPARQAIVVTGYLNSLGVVLLAAFAARRHVGAFLGAHPEWIYYGLVTLAMSLVGGEDVDRFALWMAPLLLAAGAWRAPAGCDARLLLHLVALQLVAGELLLPWAADRAFYFSLSAPYSLRSGAFGLVSVSCWLLVAVHAGMRGLAGARAAPQDIAR